MARNIRILLGKQEQTFNGVRRIVTDNAAGDDTYDWVAESDLAEKEVTENGVYVAEDEDVNGYSKVTVNVAGGAGTQIEKEITENGVYTALDDDNAYGYSRVRVNVSSGVGPEGEEIEAQAVENISAGDTVYVLEGSSGGTASTYRCKLSGNAQSIAYNNRNTVYFASIDGEVYTIPYDDLISGETPLVTPRPSTLYRNLLFVYENDVWKIKNISNNREINSQSNNIGFTTRAYVPTGLYGSSRTWLRIDSFESGLDIHYFYRQIAPSKAVAFDNDWNAQQYTIYDTGVSTTVSIPVKICGSVNSNAWNADEERIYCYRSEENASGFYEFGYFEIGSSTFHKLADSTIIGQGLICWDSKGERLWASLGDKGLAVVSGGTNVAVYSNVICDGSGSALFGDYFLARNGNDKTVYFIPSNNTMGRTSSKSHAGSLGYVQEDIAQGETGKAIILFN